MNSIHNNYPEDLNKIIDDYDNYFLKFKSTEKDKSRLELIKHNIVAVCRQITSFISGQGLVTNEKLKKKIINRIDVMSINLKEPHEIGTLIECIHKLKKIVGNFQRNENVMMHLEFIEHKAKKLEIDSQIKGLGSLIKNGEKNIKSSKLTNENIKFIRIIFEKLKVLEGLTKTNKMELKDYEGKINKLHTKFHPINRLNSLMNSVNMEIKESNLKLSEKLEKSDVKEAINNINSAIYYVNKFKINQKNDDVDTIQLDKLTKKLEKTKAKFKQKLQLLDDMEKYNAVSSQLSKTAFNLVKLGLKNKSKEKLL